MVQEQSKPEHPLTRVLRHSSERLDRHVGEEADPKQRHHVPLGILVEDRSERRARAQAHVERGREAPVPHLESPRVLHAASLRQARGHRHPRCEAHGFTPMIWKYSEWKDTTTTPVAAPASRIRTDGATAANRSNWRVNSRRSRTARRRMPAAGWALASAERRA